jgi:hypothetical protein
MPGVEGVPLPGGKLPLTGAREGLLALAAGARHIPGRWQVPPMRKLRKIGAVDPNGNAVTIPRLPPAAGCMQATCACKPHTNHALGHEHEHQPPHVRPYEPAPDKPYDLMQAICICDWSRIMCTSRMFGISLGRNARGPTDGPRRISLLEPAWPGDPYPRTGRPGVTPGVLRNSGLQCPERGTGRASG